MKLRPKSNKNRYVIYVFDLYMFRKDRFLKTHSFLQKYDNNISLPKSLKRHDSAESDSSFDVFSHAPKPTAPKVWRELNEELYKYLSKIS